MYAGGMHPLSVLCEVSASYLIFQRRKSHESETDDNKIAVNASGIRNGCFYGSVYGIC